MKYYCIVAFSLIVNFLFAQKEQQQLLKFTFKINTVSLPSASYVKLTGKDSIRVDECKFYISNLSFLNKSKVVYTEKESYHLIDITDPKSLQIACITPQHLVYDQLSFYLGIDSVTNVSGVMEGDLDPTRGMYWTWQSGYINLKLEGKSSLCSNPRKEFQIHLGGYQKPFLALQKVLLNTPTNPLIDITFDLGELMQSVDLVKAHHVMSPTHEAVRLSEIAARCFKTAKK